MKIFCLAALVSTSTAVNNIPTSGYVGCISGMNTAYITNEWKYGGGNDATPWIVAGYDELNYPSGFTCENGAGASCTYPSDSSLSSKYMDYWNQCRDNCQSEGNGYEFFSLACGKECRCFNAAALPQSKNDVGTGFDSSGSPNWGYGKANNKWYPMNQCSSNWNNDWCGRPAAFEFGGRTYLNGASGRAAIYCANPDGCTAPDSYVPSNTPNPTTTTTTTTTTATSTTSTTSTAPTYTHGSVPSGGGSFGSSACPVMCKSDGKTLQVFHSTIHGTGLDDTSVHSPSNVMPHSCMHNKDTNKCECTCTSATTPPPGCVGPCCTPETKDFKLVKKAMIPSLSSVWNTASDVPLAVNNPVPATISRVAYCLRLNDEWVWTSFDWTDTAKIGVPADYQINGDVENLKVFSNAADVADASYATGRAEFWHNCYRRRLNQQLYGDADTPNEAAHDCYGSMQIHTKAHQTLFGFNGWSDAQNCDVTIGNDIGYNADGDGTDGTVNGKCNDYNADGKSAIYTYVQ